MFIFYKMWIFELLLVTSVFNKEIYFPGDNLFWHKPCGAHTLARLSCSTLHVLSEGYSSRSLTSNCAGKERDGFLTPVKASNTIPADMTSSFPSTDKSMSDVKTLTNFEPATNYTTSAFDTDVARCAKPIRCFAKFVRSMFNEIRIYIYRIKWRGNEARPIVYQEADILTLIIFQFFVRL